MSKERIAIFGVALAFYVLGGWSHGQHQEREAITSRTWQRTDVVIKQAYVNDAVSHGLTDQPLLGYRYITRGIQRQPQPGPASMLERARGRAATVQFEPEDPASAVMLGEPRYSTGLGLIGLGTLLALCRELVLRRRGQYRGETMPFAWQGLIEALRKPL